MLGNVNTAVSDASHVTCLMLHWHFQGFVLSRDLLVVVCADQCRVEAGLCNKKVSNGLLVCDDKAPCDDGFDLMVVWPARFCFRKCPDNYVPCKSTGFRWVPCLCSWNDLLIDIPAGGWIRPCIVALQGLHISTGAVPLAAHALLQWPLITQIPPSVGHVNHQRAFIRCAG